PHVCVGGRGDVDTVHPGGGGVGAAPGGGAKTGGGGGGWGAGGAARPRAPASASAMAFASVAGAPIVPPSAMPFIPPGVCGDGVSTWPIAIGGIASAFGIA